MWNNISFSNIVAGESVEVPIEFREIVEKLLNLKSGAIVEIPFYTNHEYMIPLLYTLAEISSISDEDSKKITDYDIGDTLILGEYVFKYEGVDSQNKDFVKLRFKDGWQIVKSDICPALMKSNLKILSSDKGFYEALNNNNGLSTNGIITMQHSIEKSNIYLTVKSRAKEMVSSVMIDGISLIDNYLIGELAGSRMEIIGKRKKDGIPSLIISSDIEKIYMHIERNPNQVGTLFIDDDEYKLLSRNYGVLDMLLDKGVKIFIIADWYTMDSDEVIRTKGLPIIRENWDNGQKDFSNPSVINKMISNFRRKNIVEHIVECYEINETRHLIRQMARKIKQELGEVQDIFYLFVRFFYRLSDDISVKDSFYQKKLMAELREIERMVDEVANSSSASFNSTMLSMIKLMKSLIQQPDSKKKAAVAKLLSQESKLKKIAVIYDRNQDFERVRRFFKMMNYHHVELFTQDQFKSNQSMWDLVISSVFYGKTFKHVVRKWNFKKMHILLYEFQKEYFNRDMERINRRDTSGHVYDEYRTQPQAADNEVNFDSKISLTANERIYQAHVSRNSNNQALVEAIPVSLSNNYLGFFTESKKLFDTTTILLGMNNTVILKEASKLKVGDYIAIRDTDKDIIKALVDLSLEKTNQVYLRDIADSWREPLIDYYKQHEMIETFKMMNKHGCEKEEATIRNWIFNEDLIGPSEKRDLEAIAKLTSSSFNVDSTYNAIKDLRSMHQKAGRALTKAMGERLKNVGNRLSGNTNINSISIDGIGEVKILRVNHIGSRMKVPLTDLNRLHEGA